MEITYKIERLEDSDGFLAYCPYIKPLRVFGRTREIAKDKFSQATRLYLKKHPELEQLDTITI